MSRHPTDRETQAIEREIGLDSIAAESLSLYIVEGGPSLGYVVAAGLWMSTDREEDNASSPLLGDWDCGPITSAEGPLIRFV